MKINLLALIALVLSGCSAFNFSIENDIVGGTDNNFTNGVQLSARTDHSLSGIGSYIPVPRLMDTDPEVTSHYLMTLDQRMYTPENLKAHEVLKDQEPYCGTLTLGEKNVKATEDRRVSAQLRVGTSGAPSLAGATQKFVHDGLTSLGKPQTHPNGWDNQISAEPLVNYDYERAAEDFRLTGYGLEFSDLRSTLVRVGNINTDLTLTNGLVLGKNTPRLNETPKGFSAFSMLDGFVAGRAQNIAYDGGIFRDSIHTVDSKPLIYGAEAGVQVGWKSLIVRFIYNIQSRDFSEQSDRFHSYGLLSFGTDW